MTWEYQKIFPELQKNQLHVWRINLTTKLSRIGNLYELLDLSEKQRAAKFISQCAKNNFIITRSMLRKLISKYLKISASNVKFSNNNYGKLFIENQNINLQFNNSHSGDYALCAFVLNHHVGVDIEQIRNNFDKSSIAQRFFTKEESFSLLNFPSHLRTKAFFNCWACKEAIIKAIGHGMFFGLDNFSVKITAKKSTKVNFKFLKYTSDNNNVESLKILQAEEGYSAAIATSLRKYNLKLYTI